MPPVIGSALLGIALVIIQSPIFFELLRRILARGLLEGVLLSLGGFLAYFSILLALFFGAKDILILDSVKFLLFLIGGVVLLGIGIDSFRTRESEIYDPVKKSIPKGHPIAVGFGLAISNPFDMALWVSVGLGYLSASSKVAAFMGLSLFALSIVMVFFGLASIIYLSRKRISKKHVLFVSRFFSCILILYSFYFFLQFFKILFFY